MTDIKVKRVLMTKKLARSWLRSKSKTTFHLKVLYKDGSSYKWVKILKAFRNGKLKRVAGLEPITDLGVKESFDYFVIWSRDYDKMNKLATWFEKNGYETSGVF